MVKLTTFGEIKDMKLPASTLTKRMAEDLTEYLQDQGCATLGN